LRKLAAAALAVPLNALVHLPLVLRRRIALRTGLAIGLAAVIGAGAVVISAAQPSTTAAQKPRPILTVPAAALRTDLRTGQAPDAAVRIAFSQRMNPASVRAALGVEPAAAMRTTWSSDGTVLTVSPLRRWATGTYYTITVEPGALSEAGTPLATPVRAVFLTRPTTTATLAATGVAGTRVRTDTSFVAAFDAPLDATTLDGALRIEPPVAGAWTRVGSDPGERWAFDPIGRLAPDTTYRLFLAGSLRDADGAKVDADPLEVRTAPAPSVVRFRPANGGSDVSRGASLFVRFSEGMDRKATEAAFRATSGGKTVKGTVRWKDGDTVLVFAPSAKLGYSKTVKLSVSDAAMSVAGVPLADAATATFRTEPKPAPPPPARTSSGGSGGGGSGGSGGGGGGSVGSGSWTAVEAYYMQLMNCTRTGGWVTSSGGCSSPGGRNVAPLKLDAGISSKVARPYAKKLATSGACSHGDPAARLRAAGYTSYIWAENLGCRSGDPYAAVLGSHLFFQAEKPTNGGHYVNLMNAKYDRAGVGVWVSSGRVRLVIDFYHPL
jgi:uncharacterized protein YkwD